MTDNNHESCRYCQQTSYLPVRSGWARVALTKIESNQRLDNIDRTTWYRLKHFDQLEEEYRSLFEEFNEDEDTKAFIEQSQAKSDNLPVQMLHSIASSFLTMFIARTSGEFDENRRILS